MTTEKMADDQEMTVGQLADLLAQCTKFMRGLAARITNLEDAMAKVTDANNRLQTVVGQHNKWFEQLAGANAAPTPAGERSLN